VLKKAGIVVAAAAASLMAVSPLAFAGEKSHGNDWGHKSGQTERQVNSISDDNEQAGLVNVGDVNALNNLAVCSPVNAAVPVSVLGILGGNQGVDQEAGNVVCAPGDRPSQTNIDD
jgi:hypothetical protein